jgi:surface carbohydrate biosynthesis protein (TIGR04326 family)
MAELGGVGKQSTLLVWDVDSSPPKTAGKTALWRSIAGASSSNLVSMPLLVEANAENLKRRYLSWVYDLGEAKVGGQRLIDLLQLRPGFSYWWMTMLAEKCNYSKSSQIDHVIRLLAFEAWAAEHSFNHLILATSDERLADCFRSWCAKSDLSFEWRRTPEEEGRRSRFKRLPHSARAVIWLFRYLVRRWPLKGVGLSAWHHTAGRTTFASYTLNLKADAAKAGKFESQYWGALPGILGSSESKSNWIHLYVEDSLLPTAKKAAETFRRFNAVAKGTQTHVTVDTFLGWGVVCKSLRDWLRFRKFANFSFPNTCPSSDTEFDFWPLFQDEWRRSLEGAEGLGNFLSFNLLDSALASLPTQDVGVYLQENQAWEFAFIHAWQTAGHRRLIGTPHSTVRYWDLRYFFDPRNYVRTGDNDLPLPNLVALNGTAAMSVFQAGKYPSEQLVEVEALRYLYLDGNGVVARVLPPKADTPRRILVLGDYDASHTRKQLRLLENAVHLLPKNVLITVKPHPAFPVRAADYPRLKVKITHRVLFELLAEADIAYTSSITSAAVDAYCAGVPVVSLLDPSTLNMSPLRGRQGVQFVHTPEQLAHALVSEGIDFPRYFCANSFFCLDKTIPRWRNLLELTAGSQA